MADDRSDRPQRDVTRDLIPSPPASPRTGNPILAQPISDTYKKAITTEDLKHRVCWICTEGDDEEEVTANSAKAGKDKVDSKGRFVHACKCTLVAHESCLMQWIESKELSQRQEVTCPQCKTRYQIKSPKPLVLQLFEGCDDFFQGLLPFAGYGTALGFVFSSLTAYGVAAFAAWVGTNSASRVLSGKWPWYYWVNLPAIPVIMLLGRLPGGRDYVNFSSRMYSAVLLQGVAAELTIPSPSALQWHGLSYVHYDEGLSLRRMVTQYPPTPAVTAVLFPWVRMIYGIVRRRVTRYVLRSLIKRKDEAQAPNSIGIMRDRLGREVHMSRLSSSRLRVVIGENLSNDTDGEYDDHLPIGVQSVTQTEVTNIGEQVDQNRPPMLIGRPVQRYAQQTVYISFSSFARLTVETFSLPFIASGIGQGISFLAKRRKQSHWLNRLLGRRSTQDSQHWRNTLSLWLYVVARDSLSLAYRYLRLKQRTKTSIVDLPFDDNIAKAFETR